MDLWIVSYPRSGNSLVALTLLSHFPGDVYRTDSNYIKPEMAAQLKAWGYET